MFEINSLNLTEDQKFLLSYYKEEIIKIVEAQIASSKKLYDKLANKHQLYKVDCFAKVDPNCGKSFEFEGGVIKWHHLTNIGLFTANYKYAVYVHFNDDDDYFNSILLYFDSEY